MGILFNPLYWLACGAVLVVAAGLGFGLYLMLRWLQQRRWWRVAQPLFVLSRAWAGCIPVR